MGLERCGHPCPECDGPIGSEAFETTHTCDPDVMFEKGAAAYAGVIAMAEAIRNRPRYTWKLVTFFGTGGNHSVSWHSDEASARESAAIYAKLGDRPAQITKEEVDWCPRCDGSADT